MEHHARLTRSLIERIEADRRGWPKRSQFLRWYRDDKGFQGSVEHSWADLKLGRFVPRQIAEGFVQYLREKRGYEEAGVEGGHASPEGVWRDLRSVVHYATERFFDDDSMYLKNPYRDPFAVAEMLASSVGRKSTHPDDESDLDAGQRIMGITLDALTRWVAAMWRAEFRTVMFSMADGCRVATSIILPMREESFDRLYSGDLGCWEIAPSDLEQPSRFLFIMALGEDPLPNVSTKGRTAAQAHCMFYQASYFTRRSKRPVFLAIATNEQYAIRLKRHGYLETGNALRHTDKPIVVLRHPAEVAAPTQRDWLSYRLMLLMIRMYQTANARRWKLEDRLKN